MYEKCQYTNVLQEGVAEAIIGPIRSATTQILADY